MEIVLLIALLCLAFTVVLGLFFKQAAVKGKCGELFVANRLKSALEPEQYLILNNVLLPDGLGGTTQIDHVVLSPFGIFVVETKNMKGWIFGDRNSRMWMQQIYNCKNQFQNPFFQNYKHIACLSELTNLPAMMFIHTVVFLGDCTIKTRSSLPESLVTNARELVAFIKTYQKPVLDNNTLKTVQNAIASARLGNTVSNQRNHVQYLQNKFSTVSSSCSLPSDDDFPLPPDAPTDPIQQKICPQCGAPMVLRQAGCGRNAGQYFWGCSQYPRCHCTLQE